MRRIILIISFFLPISSICFAQSNYTESLTITTYYPAPYGVYRNLKLNPSNVPTAGVSRGVMFFNNSSDTLQYYNRTGWQNFTGGGGLDKLKNQTAVCNSTNEAVIRYNSTTKNVEFCNGSVWVNMTGDGGGGGGGSPGDILVGAAHTQGDCTTAGGTVDSSGTTYKLCRFRLPACPVGWQPYLSWSNTTARTCVGGQCCGSGNQGCSVAGHPWSNTPIEHCQYFGPSTFCGQYDQWCQGMNVCYGCGYNYLKCPCADCQATVNEMGCQ